MDNISKESLSILAYLYIEHFKYEKALTLLKALNKLYPKDIDIRRSLAYAYLKNGDYQAALKFAEASMKSDLPQSLIIASNLIKGKALWGLGKEEAARHALSEIIKKKKEIKK